MNLKDVMDAIIIERDSENRLIIEMNILDSSSFVSPFCGKHPVISAECAEYIETQMKRIPPKEEVAVKIRTNDSYLSDNAYEDAIKNYYLNDTIELGRDLVTNLFGAIALLLIGMVVFAIMAFCQYKNVPSIWCSILEIVSWVFIWEAVDKYVFERRKIKRDIAKDNQILVSKITVERVEKSLPCSNEQ